MSSLSSSSLGMKLLFFTGESAVRCDDETVNATRRDRVSERDDANSALGEHLGHGVHAHNRTYFNFYFLFI